MSTMFDYDTLCDCGHRWGQHDDNECLHEDEKEMLDCHCTKSVTEAKVVFLQRARTVAEGKIARVEALIDNLAFHEYETVRIAAVRLALADEEQDAS